MLGKLDSPLAAFLLKCVVFTRIRQWINSSGCFLREFPLKAARSGAGKFFAQIFCHTSSFFYPNNVKSMAFTKV